MRYRAQLNRMKKAASVEMAFKPVGVTGLEPATPCTPCKCATGLRYTPKLPFPHFDQRPSHTMAGRATGLRYTLKGRKSKKVLIPLVQQTSTDPTSFGSRTENTVCPEHVDGVRCS